MNKTQWTTPPPPRSHADSGWFGALVGVFIFLITLRLGIGTAGTNLDESWSAVIAWAHVNNAQWGSAVIFNYGPLGWLNPYATYNPALFPVFFASQIALSFGIAVTFGLAASLLRGLGRIALLLALFVLSPWLHSDVLLLGSLTLAVAAVEQVARARPGALHTLLLAVVATLCAALALLKFSFFPLAAGAWLVGTLLLTLRRRTLIAAGWLLGMPAAALALWLANGQAVAGIPDFLRNSAEIAAAYSHAMGTSGALSSLVGCATAGAGVAALLLAWLRAERAARLRALAVSSYLAATLFVVWRASFTRADDAHAGFFLPIAALAALVVMGFTRDLAPRLRHAATLAFVLLTAASLWLVAPKATPETYRGNAASVASIWRSLLDPASLRAQYDAGRAALRSKLDLPRVRALVGTQRIDLLTSAQGLVLVNDLTFAPRPIFQSYQASTPKLLRLNEAYFLSTDAPPFVLLKMEALDQRYPASEDALALLALWRNYQPVEIEQGFVLLQRVRDTRDAMPAAAASYADAAPGGWIEVPAHASALLLHADIGLSVSGRLFATLLREPALLMDVALDNGEVRQFRLARGTASSGFLLSPFLADERSYVHWFYGERQPAVQRIRFVSPVDWQQRLLAPRLRVGFTPLELPREAGSQLPARLVAALYPGFDLAPAARSGMTEAIVEDGQPALFMHALSTLDFSPAPGRYRLTARYGVRRAAYDAPSCTQAQADGIHFQIDVVSGGQATPQLQRDTNPFRNEQERGPQTATAESVQISTGDSLRVTVAPGAGGNAACDWGYLAELRLQELHP